MKKSSNVDLMRSNKIIEYIKSCSEKSSDISYRKVKFNDEYIYIVYADSMSSTDLISNFIIKSIVDISKNKEEISLYEKQNFEEKNAKEKWHKYVEDKNSEKKKSQYLILNYIEDKISINNVKNLDFEKDDLFYYIFSGFALIIYKDGILALETKKNVDRSIDKPIIENNIRGPKDAFNESFMTNVGLIRKRIKTEKLVLKEQKVGRRTKTKVGIMYVSDIAKKDMVKHIEDYLKKIDIDGILDSNYIVEFIEQNNNSDFPTVVMTEKPDLVSYYLLQGRVAIIVENSPFVIVVPAFLQDFVNNIDDSYVKNSNIIITRIIRYIAFVLTIITPALYIALITFDQESIPTDLLISFAKQRDSVPFPAFVEAMLMIISFEILRETDYRVPNVAGNTLSIVGALILGDAAVSAGIVSPIMIIVIAITMISGLMFSDINILNSLRTWRLIFLFFASISGIFGIGIATMFLIIKMCSITSMGKPYTYPIAPLNFSKLDKNFITRKNISKDRNRQKILTNNLIKLKNKQ